MFFDIAVASEPADVNNSAITAVNDPANIDLNLVNNINNNTTTTTPNNNNNNNNNDDDDNNMETNCPNPEHSTVVLGDEPYVGQEFESEDAAHAFYAAYGTRMGFMTRMSSVSRKSGIIIRRTLVCNKEGYYNDKRPGQGKRKRPRTLTRVGCKANIVIRRLSTGIWVVKKILKEHNHPLADRPFLTVPQTDPAPHESKRIQELTIQLLRERKRSASFRKIIDLLFNHIKEHTEDISKTVQSIGDKINQIESDGKNPRKKPR